MHWFFTARKCSLRRLYFYRCVSVHGGLLSQHALQVVSQHALQQVSRGYPSMPCRSPGPHTRGKLRGIWPRPTAKGEVKGDLVQAHSLGDSWGGSGPCPQPRGKLRGIWSMPTAKGEVEGDLVQAHSQGGSWGGSGPGPQPRGQLRGILLGVGGACSGGCLLQGGVETSRDDYCCRRHASYWNAFLFIVIWLLGGDIVQIELAKFN